MLSKTFEHFPTTHPLHYAPPHLCEAITIMNIILHLQQHYFENDTLKAQGLGKPASAKLIESETLGVLYFTAEYVLPIAIKIYSPNV